MEKTQCSKILEILQDGLWHCVLELIDTYSVDYRRRLCDLQKKGYQFVTRKCENCYHNHKGGMKEWRLVGSVKESPSSDKFGVLPVKVKNRQNRLFEPPKIRN